MESDVALFSTPDPTGVGTQTSPVIPGCTENNPAVFVTSICAASWRRAFHEEELLLLAARCGILSYRHFGTPCWRAKRRRPTRRGRRRPCAPFARCGAGPRRCGRDHRLH
eukprot:scaffold38188_cov67-Phaeocystis_antarctica.AAC.3